MLVITGYYIPPVLVQPIIKALGQAPKPQIFILSSERLFMLLGGTASELIVQGLIQLGEEEEKAKVQSIYIFFLIGVQP